MTSVPAAWRAVPSFSGALGAPLAGLVLYTPLLATILLAKVSLPPFAALSLSIAYLFIFLAAALGVALGHLRVDSRRLSFFLVFIGSIGVVQVFRGDVFSLTSMLLLGSLHLAYVFTLPGREAGGRWISFSASPRFSPWSASPSSACRRCSARAWPSPSSLSCPGTS